MPELVQARCVAAHAAAGRRGRCLGAARSALLAGLSALAWLAAPAGAAPAGAAPAPAQDCTAPASKGTSASPCPRPSALHMPVQGVRAQDLRDTYADQRGGGARAHEALDIMAPRGTPVLAASDGRIARLFLSKPGGITIYQFDPGGRWAYYYAHLDRYADGLAEGQTVQRGQLLGYVGSTGNADPEAPHLHFGIFRLDAEQRWWTGVPMNPFPCLRAAGTGSTPAP